MSHGNYVGLLFFALVSTIDLLMYTMINTAHVSSPILRSLATHWKLYQTTVDLSNLAEHRGNADAVSLDELSPLTNQFSPVFLNVESTMSNLRTSSVRTDVTLVAIQSHNFSQQQQQKRLYQYSKNEALFLIFIIFCSISMCVHSRGICAIF